MKPKIHELARHVVTFNDLIAQHPGVDLYPICRETVLLITQDQDMATGLISWHCVTDFQWWYSAVDRLCNDRACRVETGDLLPNGTKCKPEDYLRHWRQARAAAISFEQMMHLGIRLHATISLPSAFCQAVQAEQDARYAPMLQRMGSPFLIQADEHETVWHIPITDLATLQDYQAVKSAYFSEQKYPGEFKRTFTLCHAPATTPRVAKPVLAPINQLDLFQEAA